MNIALIAQISVGVAFPGALSIWMFAPNWLGIYGDVDIYLTDAEVKTTALSTDDSNAESPAVKTSDNEAGIQKNMNCWIGGNTKHDCAIYTTNTTVAESKKQINASDFTKKVSSIDTTTGTTTKYYKIRVSEKLLQELQDSTDKTISISAPIANDTKKKLKALFAHGYSKILHMDKSKKEQYQYVGKVTEASTTQTTTTTGNKYQCSSSGGFKGCNIFSLHTSDATEINNAQFTESATEATTITLNNWYLIKSDNPYNESISVNIQPASGDATKTTIKDLKLAFVADISGTKTLFHFA